MKKFLVVLSSLLLSFPALATQYLFVDQEHEFKVGLDTKSPCTSDKIKAAITIGGGDVADYKGGNMSIKGKLYPVCFAVLEQEKMLCIVNLNPAGEIIHNDFPITAFKEQPKV